MQNWFPRRASVLSLCATLVYCSVGRAESTTPPDLLQSVKVDRTQTYNLGATGLRGWIFSKPQSSFDGLQGRTTASSRQILVTHVGAKSPADGVLKVDDVILGVGGKLFNDDARKSFALAIQDAEKEANGGVLKLTCSRAGKSQEFQIKLKALGTYSDTAPFDCPKSKRIFEEACQVLNREPLDEVEWNGSVNGLALLATGNPDYLPRLQKFARKVGPPTLKLKLAFGSVIWDWSYRNLFLCEYYLATGDKDVLPAIHEYTITLAKGQSLFGTFGHGVSSLTSDGKLHGSIPPYGPVNMAGLPANLSIILGKKCGVKHVEVDRAILNASRFFGYFTDKGAIPYGEHEPWPYHENNGKNSMCALLFSLQDDRIPESQFFAKMATAGYRNRECGHTGQGFSYLWSALGANVGGPGATAAFFKEASWHLDLVRRSDGSFTYDGDEQYGAGQTDDNTYFGNSSYNGLSPTASYVLTYALPLKKISITGKDAKPTSLLSQKEVADAIASGCFDTERKKKSPMELVAAFRDWSPIVRSWAAEELSRRPEAKQMVPQLIKMAEGQDLHVCQGACETLGAMRSVEALPVFVRLLSHEDRWLRFKAAQAVKKMEGDAKRMIPELLKVVVKTAAPQESIDWADPIQLTHGQLAAALFTGSQAKAVKKADPKLVHPAIRVIANNADGMARSQLQNYFEKNLTLADVQALAPDLLIAIKTPCPADTMFADDIRIGAFKALTKYHFQEGIAAGIVFAKTQGGHGSESRTGVIMAEIASYGTAAKDAVPQLKEVIVALNDQCKRREFPGGELNARRVRAVENAIKVIETATEQPKLNSLSR